MFGTTLVLAFREIRRHLMRSFLTTLGIIIGVAAVITMVTLGNGVSAQVKQQISSLGSNVLMVFPVRGDRAYSRPFHEDDVRAIGQQIAGVEQAAGEVETSATAIHNGQNWSTTVNGANNDFMQARNMEVDTGRRFTEREQAAGESVCIIGPKVLDNIFPAEADPLGERLRLNDVSCTVVGTLKSRGLGGGGGRDEDNVVIMPLKTVQRRFTGSRDIQFMVISYDDRYDSKVIQSSLIDLLRERRRLQGSAENDFNIIDTAEIAATAAQSTAFITAFLAAVGAISLIVGGVGIMNIMLVSVTERTREIGIRLAIGALAREVRMQFLTEAVVLCCLGGVVGVLLALGLSIIITGAMGVPFTFDPVINIIAFGVSALIGVIFGYFPAQRAAALDPIEALRHE
ncbi:ABC transporter permease [Stakelama saccharophila]|uniref:ABC transporter permease n=1 Tax=Stakelama saccharophila TaxID=3075605 RepID=A0ABZ0BAY9_9SPHN|nr:ABC transporter permease [Stakelama sp. W311]WNO54447.1 ABC transporter permease [Stakelama sp. W311]